MSDTTTPLPTRRFRLAIALGAALFGGTLSYLLAARPGFSGDFLAWWFGAGVLLDGGDPYAVGPTGAPWFVNDRLFYPLTAVVATIPLARLPLAVAQGLFVAIGSGVLGWVVSRDGTRRLPLFLSFPYLISANLGHWSPFVAAAILSPVFGWLVAVKPNLAVAAVASRPSRRMIVGGAIFVAVSLAVSPTWPLRWLAAMREAPHHPIPVLTLLGAPLVLAALRWREWEGRLLLAMALLPQTMSFADQLVLMLVPRTRKESLVAAIASLVGGVLWVRATATAVVASPLVGTPYVMAGVYLPLLAFVLMRARDRSASTSESVSVAEPRTASVPSE